MRPRRILAVAALSIPLLLASRPPRAATPGAAGGEYFGVAVDEAGRAWKWGHDTDSPGYPGFCDCSPPEPVPGPGGTGTLEGIVQVAATRHVLALGADGTVWAWGVNDEGQLGRGFSGAEATLPERVHGPGNAGFLSGIVAVAAGWNHSLALKSDGSVWAWGGGSSGQLGAGSFSSSTSPVQVRGASGTGTLAGADAIDAGLQWSLVLVDGAALTFGRDVSGQRSGAASNVPVPVAASAGGPGLTGISAISAGDDFALFLMPDGTLLSWGAGFRGQLGNGRQTGDGLAGSIHHFFPAPVKSPDGTGVLTGVTQASAGSEHALALRNDGSVWAWGDGSPNIIGGSFPINALGLGTSTDADGPYQALPAPVLGIGGTGTLTGMARVEAASGPAWSLAITAGGIVASWGSNYYGELGFKDSFCPGCDVFPGGGTRFPREVCALRLRDLSPHLTCPDRIDPEQQVTISWTPVGAATSYEVRVDGGAPVTTTETSYVYTEPPAECLPEGFAHRRTFSVAAIYPTTCEAQPVECSVPRFSPFTRVPEPPAVSCPASVFVGGEIVLDWPDDPGVASWEVDTNADGIGDAVATDSTLTLTATTVGDATFAVRGSNPCGTGAWSEACATRVRPDTSHCVSMGAWQACTSAWTEDPPGTFSAESDYIRLSPAGAEDSDFAVWVSGALQLVPATGEAYFDGVVWADTAYGRIDLFDNADAYGAPVTGGVAQGSLLGRLLTRLPTGPALVQNAFASGMRRLLRGVPCTKETPKRQFVVGCLPFDGQVRIWLNLTVNLLDPFANCVVAEGRFGVEGVPENGDVYAEGTAGICPGNVLGLVGSALNGALDPSQAVVKIVVPTAQARLAGCEASLDDGFLQHKPTDTTTPYGMTFDTGHLSCPDIGNLRADLSDIYIGQDDISAQSGELSLSHLDAGFFTVRDFHGTLTRRDPKSLGYKICADGQVGLPFVMLDAQAGFTLLNGRLQRACVNIEPLEELAALVPGLPVFTDKILGGCFTVFAPANPDDKCVVKPDFAFASQCLDGCLAPPSGEIKIRLRAGLPVPFADGVAASIDPAGLQFSLEGVRAAGKLKLLGRSVGSADACLTTKEGSACAQIDVGIVSGSAALGISKKYGVAGKVQAQVDLPYIGCCGIGTDPAPFGVSAYIGPYKSPEEHYGFVVGFDFLGKRTAGIDIRTLEPSLQGIVTLAPFTPVSAGSIAGVLPEDVVASASFVVPAGSAQALFFAQSDAGVPVLTLISPSRTIDAATPGVHSLQDEDAAALAVDEPEAGPWDVQVSGVPAGAHVTITALGEPSPATIELTEPATGGVTVPRVAWTAAVPSAQPATELRLLASEDPEAAAAGLGVELASLTLSPGDGGFDLPEGLLAAGTWHVAARLDDGIGHISVAVAPGTLVVTDDTGPEPPPSAAATALFDGARVSWTASPSPDALGYEVLIEEADASGPFAGVVLPAGDALSLDVHSLSGVSPRRFLVRAYDASGNRGDATEAGVVVPDPGLDATPPPAPEDVTATAIGTQGVRVTWSGGGDAVSYRVAYGASAQLLGQQADQGPSPVQEDSHALDLTGFSAGQAVFAAVSAVDALGNESPRSPVVMVRLGNAESTDGDALGDDWERLNLGSLAASDGTGDADEDGLTDAEEFALGTDPLAQDDFAWGDIDGDGTADIGDVVLALRFSVGERVPDADQLRRANVAPATLRDGPPPVARPTGAAPRQVTVADVVLMLRAAVGLVSFDTPFPEE